MTIEHYSFMTGLEICQAGPGEMRMKGKGVPYDEFDGGDGGPFSFRQMFVAGSLAESVADSENKGFFIQHNHRSDGLPLATTDNGGLVFTDTPTGLMVDVTMSEKDPDALLLREKVDSGIVGGMSIGVEVKKADWDYEKDPIERRIEEAKLVEVSAVWNPFFKNTDIALHDALEARKSMIAREGRKGWRDPKEVQLLLSAIDMELHKIESANASIDNS